MEPAASIRRIGFRKWYERQLIVSHVSLITCFICGIAIAALVEEVNVLDFGSKGVLLIGVLAGMILLGWFAWRRYITVLGRAERYGQRSTCPQCQAYGRFEVLSTGDDGCDTESGPDAPLPAAWMRVRCRKCGTAWSMP